MLEEYKNKHKVKVGLLPTRRNISRKNFFDKDVAMHERDLVEEKLHDYNIEYVNLDFLNEEGLIFQGIDADKVAKKFLEEEVDAVFAPHCNFGTEDAIARVAKKVNKPLLLWGPRDDAPQPDGFRSRDTQCGLFATSKVLNQFGVPFTYAPNTGINDILFEKCFKNFISTASIVKAFRNLRIGQIGVRPGAFWTVKYNEEELLERFGIEVIAISIADLKRFMDALIKDKQSDVKEMMNNIRGRVNQVAVDDAALEKIAALKIAIKNWADMEGLSSVGLLCGMALRELTGITPCFTMADLTDDGLPVTCETDIHGAITSIMSQAAVFGNTATFLADMTVRHPQNDNGELLWHCGVFPHSLRKNDEEAILNNHYGTGNPGACEWEIKGGDITVSRFDGMNGNYQLLIAEGKGIEGPKNKGTYVWVEFKDWMKLENRLIHGPYIHHCTGVHAKIAPALYEACKYIPGLSPDPVDPTEDDIKNYLMR